MVNKSSQISVLAAATMLPLAIIIGQLVAWYYKSVNPNDVDVSAGLAYLRQILLSAIGVLVLLWMVSLIAGLRGLRSEMKKIAKLGLIILCINTVLMLGLAGLNKINSDIVDNAEKVNASVSK